MEFQRNGRCLNSGALEATLGGCYERGSNSANLWISNGSVDPVLSVASSLGGELILGYGRVCRFRHALENDIARLLILVSLIQWLTQHVLKAASY